MPRCGSATGIFVRVFAKSFIRFTVLASGQAPPCSLLLADPEWATPLGSPRKPASDAVTRRSS